MSLGSEPQKGSVTELLLKEQPEFKDIRDFNKPEEEEPVEPKEEPKDPPEEPADPPEDPEEPKDEPTFLDKFNEKYETKLTQDELDGFMSRRDKLIDSEGEEVKALQDKVKQLESENGELKDIYDPKKIFVSDAEAKRQLLLRKYPEYDPAVITRVLNKESSEMKDLEAISLRMFMEDGDIYKTDTDIREAVEDKYDIDLTDLENMESVKKNKIAKEAKEARKLFDKIKSETPEDGGVDILSERDDKRQEREDKKKELKNDWNAFFKQQSKEIGDITISMGDKGETHADFTFKMDDKFKKELESKSENFAELQAGALKDATDKAKEGIMFEFTKQYLWNNRASILALYAEDFLARHIERENLKKDNPRKPKAKEEPKVTPKTKKEQMKEDAENQILENMNIKLNN